MGRPCCSCAPEKIAVPAGQGRTMIEVIRQGLKEEGFEVPIAKLCRWFGVARRSVYNEPSRATPKEDLAFAKPMKAMIEEEPSFGYRTAANLIGFNKNTMQRIFKLKGWHVRKRARKPTTRNTNNRRLDLLLQYPQTPLGPRHENTCRCLQISSLTCAESDGSLRSYKKARRVKAQALLKMWELPPSFLV